MNKTKGFSLTELLVVVAIIAIMVAIFTGAINPIAQINKANDSRRKKDLNRIKIAFEDYYNDNSCYPTQDFIEQLTNASNCGDDEMFSPWLTDWPCDPVSKEPYMIVVEDDDDCPDWFKIYANLENRNDNDIPEGWYSEGTGILLSGGYSIDNVNYGTSSTNVSWFEDTFVCSGECVTWTSDTSCDDQSEGCYGPGCYLGDCHNPRCQCNDCRFGVCYD